MKISGVSGSRAHVVHSNANPVGFGIGPIRMGAGSKAVVDQMSVQTRPPALRQDLRSFADGQQGKPMISPFTRGIIRQVSRGLGGGSSQNWSRWTNPGGLAHAGRRQAFGEKGALWGELRNIFENRLRDQSHSPPGLNQTGAEDTSAVANLIARTGTTKGDELGHILSKEASLRYIEKPRKPGDIIRTPGTSTRGGGKRRGGIVS